MTRPTIGRRPMLAVVVVLCATMVAACGDDDTQPATSRGDTHTVNHAQGETEVPDDPQRIAVLWRPTLSAMVDLDFDPVAVAADDPSGDDLDTFLPDDYPIDQLDVVGTTEGPDVEAIAVAQPDLILSVNVRGFAEAYDDLSEIAPTVSLGWEGTGSWRSHLAEVAEVLEVPDRADDVIADYDEHVDRVRAAVGDPASIEASIVRVQSTDVLRLETPESFPGQVFDDIGFARPESQIEPDSERDFAEISLELMPRADGDVIFTLANESNDQARSTITQSELWNQLDAARTDRVYHQDYAAWGGSSYRAAHRILDDVQAAFEAGQGAGQGGAPGGIP